MNAIKLFFIIFLCATTSFAANYTAIQQIEGPDNDITYVTINTYKSQSLPPEGLSVTTSPISWPTYFSHTEVVEDEIEGSYTNDVYVKYDVLVWDNGLRGANQTEKSEYDAWVAQNEYVENLPPTDLIQTAAIFKRIYRIHFGEGAETNTNITQNTVTEYFLNRRLTGTSEPTDGADMLVLFQGFQDIKGFTGDGTIWSFPWEVVPE